MSASTCSSLIQFEGKTKIKKSQYSRGYGIDGSGENGNEIGKAHPEGRILKTETGKVVDGSDIANTAAGLQAHASSDVNLFLERPGFNLDCQKDNNNVSMLLARQGES